MPEGKKILSWDESNLGEFIFGDLEIDADKCDGCSWCVKVCPGRVLELVDKKARLNPAHVQSYGCMFEGACQAICPQDAIRLKKAPQYPGYYASVERGKLEKPRMQR